MVKKIVTGMKEYFECEQCSFVYPKKEWAEKCEGWCKQHHSCNIQITEHAVKTVQ